MRSPSDPKAVILAALAEITPWLDPQQLDEARALRDAADLDSLDVVRLLGEIETRTGARIPPAEHAGEASLAELARLVERYAA